MTIFSTSPKNRDLSMFIKHHQSYKIGDFDAVSEYCSSKSAPQMEVLTTYRYNSMHIFITRNLLHRVS